MRVLGLRLSHCRGPNAAPTPPILAIDEPNPTIDREICAPSPRPRSAHIRVPDRVPIASDDSSAHNEGVVIWFKIGHRQPKDTGNDFKAEGSVAPAVGLTPKLRHRRPRNRCDPRPHAMEVPELSFAKSVRVEEGAPRRMALRGEK
jgi:hypothetical protein